MKTQLLEDIGENNSLPAVSPDDAALLRASAPVQPAAAPKADKWTAGPWRQRMAAAPPASEPVAAAPPPPPPAPAPLLPEPQIHSFDPDPLAESWAIANPSTGPTWFERWGRRAAAVSTGLAALVLVAGAAAWMYTETKTDEALAVASLALDDPIPANVTRAPLKTVEPIDIQASELAPLETDFYADVPDFDPTPVAAKRPRSRARTIAAAPRRPKPAPAPSAAQIREAQMAETLRQCRAAGYHAQQCVKRGCVATPYGIACKG
ncbi:hypothetical protein [Massilia soli]|uniref:Uncharacterized protein n=1 Tax=Massilia soli TaxID=2792854 RepID=A0ABS7SS61_9BURK|nr:hypothetical protein [Massilia soli]MBZ2208767.1 hypothetical protein [Massilia soli]